MVLLFWYISLKKIEPSKKYKLHILFWLLCIYFKKWKHVPKPQGLRNITLSWIYCSTGFSYFFRSHEHDESKLSEATEKQDYERKYPSAGKHYCCVSFCHNYGSKILDDGARVVMHRLPSASRYAETRRRTIEILRDLNPHLKENSESTKICSVHYQGPYIQGRSIPTIFPKQPVGVAVPLEAYKSASDMCPRKEPDPLVSLDCTSESGEHRQV